MPEPDHAPRRFVFVDTEFTHLDPAVAEVVEAAYAFEDGPVLAGIPPHSLTGADPKALEVNRYYERDLGDRARWDRSIVDYLARATAGQTIVGCNPRIDAAVLAKLIGYEPWHYRLHDLESSAMLLLGFDQQPGLRLIRHRLVTLGFKIPDPDHTAAGDVEVTRACFQALQQLARYLLRDGLPTAEQVQAWHDRGPDIATGAA